VLYWHHRSCIGACQLAAIVGQGAFLAAAGRDGLVTVVPIGVNRQTLERN
jgi:hypothetical protein